MDPSGENTVPDISSLGDVGSVIDAQISPEGESLSSSQAQASRNTEIPETTHKPRGRPKKDTTPLIDPEKLQRQNLKTGPPDTTEWLDFFSRVILKVGMNSYIDFAFRGIDEDHVSDEDLAKLKVSREERDVIARPLAEFAAKNPYTRKHGRQVVALTGSIESLMTLGIWMRRVNRIAKKYKPIQAKTIRPTAVHLRSEASVNDQPNGTPSPNGTNGIQGTGRGFVSGEFGPIVNPGSG
jgi:hypothetical protein